MAERRRGRGRGRKPGLAADLALNEVVATNEEDEPFFDAFDDLDDEELGFLNENSATLTASVNSLHALLGRRDSLVSSTFVSQPFFDPFFSFRP